jgi:phosphonoacetaldehyde hydrolase
MSVELLNPSLPPQTVHTTRLQAVILDWAGTTVDHGSLAPARTLQEVFSRVHISLADSEIRRDMGLPKKDHIRGILSMPRIRDAWRALRGHTPSEADVDEMYRQFIPLQFSCLAEYSRLIPGVVEAVHSFRERGLKIGSTTGYTRAMLDLLVQLSAKEGYRPDCSLSPEDVGAGRPYPFMIYETAVRLQIYPTAAIAKFGDTPADVREGLNAGAWSIGVAGTGNSIGLSYREFQALSETDRASRLTVARAELQNAGAHYVIDSLAEAQAVLDDIDQRLKTPSRLAKRKHQQRAR